MSQTVTALGGSFDHFHQGHQDFIRFAASQGRPLLIGVTDQTLTQHKRWPQIIEPLAIRQAAVEHFCRQQNIAAEIVVLHDHYGPTMSTEIAALCVTSETLTGGQQINQRRQEQGLPVLPIMVCPLSNDELGLPIHSDRIRAGEIDRAGKNYSQVLQQVSKLTDSQKAAFTQPQGHLIDLTQAPPPSPTLALVVGDTSLETFITSGWQYQLGVFDKYRQRQKQASPTLDQLKLDAQTQNPASEITPQLVTTLQTLLRQLEETPTQTQHLFIEGEEDLAAVALALLAPLESIIYYGQPNQGIVAMVVTEELKHRVASILG